MINMKRFILQLSTLITAVVLLASCEKAENKEIFLGGKSPVLSASVSGSIPLSFATQDNQAVKFSWTNPDFEFA